MTRTRIVQWLRILLPLAALGLFSTIFLFSGRPPQESSLPYAEGTIEDLAARPSVIAPTYAGVARNGTEIEMTAESATPGRGSQTTSSAAQVAVKLTDPEGLISHLTAGAGAMTDDLIELSRGVRMTTSTGWVLTSEAFEAQIDSGLLRSRQPIVAEAPFGTVTADEMELYRAPDSPADGAQDHVLDLKGDVRMIYQP